MKKTCLVFTLCASMAFTACGAEQTKSVDDADSQVEVTVTDNTATDSDKLLDQSLDGEIAAGLYMTENETTISPITEEEFSTFTETCEASDAAYFTNFDNFDDVLKADFTGTWYNPFWGEAIRLCENGQAYAYMPGVDEYGNTLYTWKLVDRSASGKCPELLIQYGTGENECYAYYIAGVRDGYFWCNSQSLVFYKQ